MENSVIVTVGDGIGNIIETLPAVKAVMARESEKIIIVDTIPHNHNLVEHLFRNHPKVESIHKLKYDGTARLVYNMPYTKPLDSKIPVGNLPIPPIGLERYNQSEVMLNLKSVIEEPFPPELYDVTEFLQPGSTVKSYDVVMHHGCTFHNREIWEVKLVHNFHHLAEYLVNIGYSVAIIGAPNEYEGVGVNETGKPIQESIELIRNCRFYIGNDTGTYHIAAALGKPGMALFTATSPIKNHDDIFHKSIKVINSDAPCFPCQSKGNGYWLRNCKYGQRCRDLLSMDLLNEIRLKLKELKGGVQCL